MSGPLKYHYCVINERNPKGFGFSGIDGSPVHLINVKDIAAAVSDVDLRGCDPTRQNMLIHREVLEKLMDEYTVLPMRFGTISSERMIRDTLERTYSDLKRELRRLKNKIELGLKILWEREAIVGEIENTGEDLEGLRDEVGLLSDGRAREMALRMGELVETVLKNWERRYIRKIYERLKEISVDTRIDEPIGVKMILNSSFLVEKKKEGEFDRRVKELDRKYGDKLKFKYVGPVPPYDFVNLEVEWR